MADTSDRLRAYAPAGALLPARGRPHLRRARGSWPGLPPRPLHGRGRRRRRSSGGRPALPVGLARGSRGPRPQREPFRRDRPVGARGPGRDPRQAPRGRLHRGRDREADRLRGQGDREAPPAGGRSGPSRAREGGGEPRAREPAGGGLPARAPPALLRRQPPTVAPWPGTGPGRGARPGPGPLRAARGLRRARGGRLPDRPSLRDLRKRHGDQLRDRRRSHGPPILPRDPGPPRARGPHVRRRLRLRRLAVLAELVGGRPRPSPPGTEEPPRMGQGWIGPRVQLVEWSATS